MTLSPYKRNALLLFLIGSVPRHIQAQDKNCYCSISGTVVDRDMNYLVSEVIAYKLDIQDGRAIPLPACSVKTDSEGYYVCALHSKGQYIVQAHARQQPVAVKVDGKNPPRVYPLTFYPNATNIDAATRLSIADGERGSANITLVSVRPITAHVELPSKPSRATIAIALHGRDYDLPAGIAAAYEATTGSFVISSIPPETYRINTAWFSEKIDHRATVVATVQSQSVSTFNVQESSNSRIEGTVEEEAWPQPRWPSAVVLQSIGDSVRKELTSPISPDGHVMFPSVPNGEYRLIAQGADDTFVESVSVNGKQLPDQQAMTVDGEKFDLLDIKLSNHAASAEGKVSMAPHTGRASIVIQSMSDEEVRIVTTDTLQHFLITGLSPGEYRLYAWSSLKNIEYRNPDYLARFIRDSTKIILDEDEHETQLEVPLLRQTN